MSVDGKNNDESKRQSCMISQEELVIFEDPKQCTCCDLPDQSVKSLSRFLFVSLLASTTSSVFWMYTWINIDLNQYITTNEQSGMLVFVGFVTGVCLCAGVYGVWSLDRGWLMLSVIFQSSLVTTCGIYIGTLLRQTTLGASEADGQELTKFSALVLGCGITTAWLAFRTQEKIQEDKEEKKYVPGGFDLPDMNIGKFKLMIAITSTLLVLMGAELMIVGSLIEQPNGMARKMSRIHLTSWGCLSTVTGLLFLSFHLRGKGNNRAILTISATLGFLLMSLLTGVAGWMHFFRMWYKESCATWNNTMTDLEFDDKKIKSCTMELLLGDAQVVVSYIAWVTVTIHIWGCWRLAEKIQTEEIDNDQKPSTLLQVLKRKNIDKLGWLLTLVTVGTVMSGTALFITWLTFQGIDCNTRTMVDKYQLTYEAPMNCTNYIDDNDEAAVFGFSRLEMFIEFNYIPAILCIVTAGCAFYGVYDKDRGFLIFCFLLFVVIFGCTYPMMMYEELEILDGNWLYDRLPEGWPRKIVEVSAHSKVLLSFVSFFGIIFAFLLTEAVQDLRELGLEKSNHLCVIELNKVDFYDPVVGDPNAMTYDSEEVLNDSQEVKSRELGSSRHSF